MQTTNFGFWEWVQSFRSPESIIMPTFFLLLALVITGGIVINAIHRRRTEANLKRELLDRGMSADEIAAVVRARPSTKTTEQAVRRT